MKIIQISPGSGDTFYCENCLRDIWLVKALRGAGHDALMAPMYLPIELDNAPNLPGAPLFFGGINTYLQQRFALFRRTPRWLDRLFDHPGLLRRAARRAGTTRASDLGAMTVSMLRGEAGRQGKELRRLVEWLAAEQPDAVILSNALLAGLAPAIKDRTRSAVLCLLQDENAWIDFLPEPYRTQSWDAIRSAGRASDGFIAVSRYYAALMAERLALPQSRLHVVYPGIPLADFGEPAAAETPAIGYLARMSRGMGLDILGAAFLILRRQNPARRVVLKIAGGQTADDAAFVRALFARFAAAGARECVAVVPELDRAARIAFLHSLAVATVPARDPLAFGIFILEALAAGVPVVLPATGAFPEVVDATGGGLTYAPNTPEALAAALGSLLAEAERRRALGLRGRAAVQQRFTIEQTAAEIAALCAHYAGERR